MRGVVILPSRNSNRATTARAQPREVAPPPPPPPRNKLATDAHQTCCARAQGHKLTRGRQLRCSQVMVISYFLPVKFVLVRADRAPG